MVICAIMASEREVKHMTEKYVVISTTGKWHKMKDTKVYVEGGKVKKVMLFIDEKIGFIEAIPCLLRRTGSYIDCIDMDYFQYRRFFYRDCIVFA